MIASDSPLILFLQVASIWHLRTPDPTLRYVACSRCSPPHPSMSPGGGRGRKCLCPAHQDLQCCRRSQVRRWGPVRDRQSEASRGCTIHLRFSWVALPLPRCDWPTLLAEHEGYTPHRELAHVHNTSSVLLCPLPLPALPPPSLDPFPIRKISIFLVPITCPLFCSSNYLCFGFFL